MSDSLREEIAKVFFYSEEAYDNTTWEEINRKTNYYRCADAVLAVFRSFLASDEVVDLVAEALHPGLFSLSDHHYGIQFDNNPSYRPTHQAAARDEARAALTSVISGEGK